MSLDAGSQLGHYGIIASIGEGGMGEVYLAEDLRLRRRVALKVLPPAVLASPDRRRRFEHEAQTAAALNHPNICTIFDFGEADGQPFIAMEYCEGTPLAARLRERQLTIDETLDVALQIADALDEAHRHHVVHRDIKAANVMVTPRGQVKILDFGLAKTLPPEDRADSATTVASGTAAGLVMGTVAYMSPEQALGRPVDARSDLFSFGVLLYEMTTGRRPFAGRTDTEQIDALLHDEPPSVSQFNSQVPALLERLLHRMLEKDPDRRSQTAREVWNELREIRGGSGASRTAAVPAPAGRPRRRGRVWALGGVGVLIAALAGVWWWQGRTTDQRLQPAAARRLVVLPATVLAPGALASEYAYLADAVPRTLFGALADVEGLAMQSPPTSMQVAQVGGDVGKIMKAYEADLYLESDITADTTRLSWNVRLVEWPSGTVRWRRSFPGEAATYLQFVHAAADEIHASLVPDRRQGVQAASAGADSELELKYQDGVFYARRYLSGADSADFDRARVSLEHVFSTDAAHAEAAASLSFLFTARALLLNRPAEFVPMAQAWAAKGLAASRACGLCWAASSNALRFDHSAQPQQLEHALTAVRYASDAHEPYRALGRALSGIGARGLAVETNRAALQRDPMDFIAMNNLGFDLYLQGQHLDSIVALERLVSLQPDHVYGLLSLVPSLADAGRVDDAEAVLRRLEALPADRQHPTWMPVMRAIVQLERRDAAGAATSLASVRRDAARQDTAPAIVLEVAENLAPALIRAGRFDDVFEMLDLAIRRGALPSYEWLLLNPHMAPIHADPRFSGVLTSARGDFERAAGILADARSRGGLPAFLEKPLAEFLALRR